MGIRSELDETRARGFVRELVRDLSSDAERSRQIGDREAPRPNAVADAERGPTP